MTGRAEIVAEVARAMYETNPCTSTRYSHPPEPGDGIAIAIPFDRAPAWEVNASFRRAEAAVSLIFARAAEMCDEVSADTDRERVHAQRYGYRDTVTECVGRKSASLNLAETFRALAHPSTAHSTHTTAAQTPAASPASEARRSEADQ